MESDPVNFPRRVLPGLPHYVYRGRRLRHAGAVPRLRCAAAEGGQGRADDRIPRRVPRRLRAGRPAGESAAVADRAAVLDGRSRGRADHQQRDPADVHLRGPVRRARPDAGVRRSRGARSAEGGEGVCGGDVEAEILKEDCACKQKLK
jgi:hypothetical protein